MSDWFGTGETSTTSSQSIPPYIQSASKAAAQKAQALAEQPYTQYQGPRVAPLSGAQTEAVERATGQLGTYDPAFERAQGIMDTASERAGTAAGRQFPQEVDKYMSPYIKEALEPRLRDLREQNAMMINEQNAGMIGQGGRGAFGGARAAIQDAEQTQRTTQTMSDVLKRGYESAYQQAADTFARDRAAQLEGARAQAALADQYGTLAGKEATIERSNIQQALQAGQLPRQVEQAGYDTAYKDFLEQRDWDQRGLDAYLRALSGVPFEETTTQTQVQEQSTGQTIGQLAGAAATAYGAYDSFFSD